MNSKQKKTHFTCIILTALLLVTSISYAGTIYAGSTGTTGDKPQSKLWYANDTWHAVLPGGDGIYFWTLVNNALVRGPKIIATNAYRADVLWTGNELYVLLYRKGTGKLYKYDQNQTLLPGFPVNLPFAIGSESASIAVLNGVIYIVYDPGTEIRVISSSDAVNWTSFTVASEITTDDLAAIISWDNKIGVMWSNQNTDTFNFRIYDTEWLPTEVISSGRRVADDHINLKVTPEGTVLAAVKTSRGNEIDLFVRLPEGWIGPYFVSTNATRPIVLYYNRLIYVFYSGNVSAVENISYRTATLDTLLFSNEVIFMTDPLLDLEDVTSTKQVGLVPFVAAKSGTSIYYKGLFDN